MEKEKALENASKMIAQSWSYHALTDEQRMTWATLQKKQWFRDAVRGTYEQRLRALQAIYMAFCEGAGI